jgi:nucleotide-binding universal stress UspA family protein
MSEFHTVLVGYDGSDDARRAVEAAAGVVADDGIVHVLVAYKAPPPGQSTRVVKELPPEFRDSFDVLAAPESTLTEAEGLLRRHGVAHVGHLAETHPADAILEMAEKVGADLIVVGSRGLGRAARLVRGSVSTRVASHARTSVLVVHSNGD